MLTKSTPSINFIDDFEKRFSEISKNIPSWFKEIKEQSLARFLEVGVPTVKNEEWKYTNISPMTQHVFNTSVESQIPDLTTFSKYINAEDINVVFINGIFSSKLSNLGKLSKGIKIISFTQALKEDSASLQKLLNKYAPKQDPSFVALNSAMASEGYLIKIDDKTISSQLIHLIHVVSPTAQMTCSFPRYLVTIGKSSEATLLESYLSLSNETTYFSSPLIDIWIDSNSTLHYNRAQSESLKAFHIGTTRVWQERDSNLDGFSLMAGANIARHDWDIVLNGEGSNATLNGLYGVFGNQHVDNHTSVDHTFPNCTSNQLYKGILNDSSRAVFNGKIFVRPVAQKTNSYQLNKNLLFGKDCRVDTKPQLEIFADDVKCTHGATIGQLNEDEIFYLESRAIARKDAIKMLSKGFLYDVLNNVKHPSAFQKLSELLEPTLAKL